MVDTIQWEYRVETFGTMFRRAKEEDLAATLNAWGEEGWEVLTATPVEGSYRVMLVAKRPLTQSVKRERTWG